MFEDILLYKDDSERIEQVSRKQHEYKKVGSVARHLGHILYSYNTETHEIKIANVKYCKTVDFLTRKPVDYPKVAVEKNCIYRQALNKENLIKRLKREGYLTNKDY